MSKSMYRAPNYYRVVSGAISTIELNSFEARGIVYDRLWQSFLKQLRADQTCSEEDIARERAAFSSAVQRVEFGASQPQPPNRVEETHPRATASPDAGRSQESHSQGARRRFFWPIAARMVSGCAALVIVGLAYALIAVRLDSAYAVTLVERSNDQFVAVANDARRTFDRQSD